MTGTIALAALRAGDVLRPLARLGHRLWITPQNGVFVEPQGEVTSWENYPWETADEVILQALAKEESGGPDGEWEVAPEE